MSKNFFQDMIKMKSDLRNEISPKPTPKIKNIKIEKEDKPAEKAPAEQTWPPIVSNKVSRRLDDAPADGARRSKRSIWLVAGASLVFLFFAVSYLFSAATINIIPKSKDVAFNQNLTAVKDANTEGGLAFDLISLSGEENKNVEGGEVKDTTVKARGTVIIYNNFSSAVQRLDIDTRLEGSNGKLYKTEKAVTVPGLKGSTPGSVEVGIYGSVAGPSYNSGPLDFKIFGFKGTPKYSKFYARSKGDITGGFTGKMSVVTDTKKSLVINEMKATLEAKLIKKASDLSPIGVILFQDATILNIDSQSFGTSGESTQVPVGIKGTLTGFLFNEKELTKKIVNLSLPDYDGSDVYISNIKDLIFTLLNKDSAGSDIKNISFNISGTPKIVWRLDEDKLTSEVLSKSKKEFYQILATYPNVVSADVLLRPFWKLHFPSNKKDIKIMVNYP